MCYNFNFFVAYSIFKSDAECWPTSKYGLHRHPAITSLDGCAAVARHTGVKMFVSCRNSAGYFCYTYVNSKNHGTCTTRANPNKCDTYSASLAAEAQCKCHKRGNDIYIICYKCLKYSPKKGQSRRIILDVVALSA